MFEVRVCVLRREPQGDNTVLVYIGTWVGAARWADLALFIFLCAGAIEHEIPLSNYSKSGPGPPAWSLISTYIST